MELNLYLKILKKEMLSIVVIVSLALLIGTFYIFRSSPGYKIEQTFLIEASQSAQLPPAGILSQIQITSPYDEARNFTDTAVALIKSKDFAINHTQPGVAAEKVAPQLIKITVTSQNPTDAKIQIEKVASDFNQNIKELIGKDTISLNPIGPTPQAYLDKIDPQIILALSFFAGLTFALLTISLKTYFRL